MLTNLRGSTILSRFSCQGENGGHIDKRSLSKIYLNTFLECGGYKK